MNNTQGSIWRKWDLHVHTPYTYLNKYSCTDEEFIDRVIAENISCLGLTNYFKFDDKEYDLKQKLESKNITVFLNLELRLDYQNKEDDCLDLHIIFSNKVEKNSIIKFLNNISANISGTDKKLIDINEVDEFKKAVVNFDKLLTCLNDESIGLKGKFLIGFLSRGKGNARSSTNYEKIAKNADILIHSTDNPNNVDDDRKYWLEHKKPLLQNSDAHSLESIGKKFTWIKSEPTFEGLKQILFEPEYRVHLGEEAPFPPPIRINNVSFDFPANSRFQNETFCLSGKNEIALNPNFTCIIGGRGTGKSTILNLIHEKLKSGENKFFASKKIKDSNGSIISIDESVEIDNDADEKYIEFLSQNEIEDFAQDYQKLTKSVYERIIKRDEQGLISSKEEVLKKSLESFKKHIINVRKIETLKTELDQKKKELGTNKKLVDSFSSDEYKGINTDLKRIGQELNQLVSSQTKHGELITELLALQTKYVQVEPSNQYANEIDRIVKELKNITDSSAKLDFSVSTKKISDLRNELDSKKEELKRYLSGKGLTEENLKDISNANLLINSLETEIERREKEIESLQKEIDGFDEGLLTNASDEYRTEIETQIKSVSAILKGLNNTLVKPISLNFEFDESSANEEILTNFKKLFEGQIAKSNYKGDTILKEVLFCVPPKDINEKEGLIEALKGYSTSSNAKPFLIELLSVDSNFKAYKLLTKMVYLDYVHYKMVKVQYDGRAIENSSFGQRCTAVLVILLLLGNNPIIIDEPEAHLDSLLISNYLVEVIKDKKRSRQIVFATHNANFVINGDAELIHILSIDESTQTTSIKSTTIENQETRETLIGLEGGFEAFKKRERKYSIEVK